MYLGRDLFYEGKYHRCHNSFHIDKVQESMKKKQRVLEVQIAGVEPHKHHKIKETQ
jgi:hypothetical protein